MGTSEMTSDDLALKIGALAESSGVTVRALHHYDHIGLLSPSRRTAAGHRLYTAVLPLAAQVAVMSGQVPLA